MRLIEDLLKEAEQDNTDDGQSFVTDRTKQSLREQWVLGRFTQLYNETASRKLVYAERYTGKPLTPLPDFKVFDASRDWVFDIEITEARDQGRQRDLEYNHAKRHDPNWEEHYAFPFKHSIPDGDYLPTVYSRIQERVAEKAKKGYPKSTILVIYLNMFPLIHHDISPATFNDLSAGKGKLLEVWLLDSDGDKLFQIA
jgi:hypothetical protein